MRLVRWPTGHTEEVLRWGVAFALSVAFAGLIGLAIVAFVSSQDTAKQALATRDQTAASASKRITGLQADLKAARADLALAKAQSASNGAKLDAVLTQLDELGVRPVATATSAPAYRSPTTTTTTQRRASSPTTTAPPSQPGPGGTSPPTTQPPPSPGPGNPPPPDDPPPVCRLVAIPIVCT